LERSRAIMRISIALILGLTLLVPLVETVVAEDELERNKPYLYGIAAHAWWLDPEVHGEQLFPAIDGLGVTTVRIGIDWKRFEREPGEYDWSKYDRVFNELRRRELTVVANFNTIPAWASENVEGCAILDRETTDCRLRDDMRPDLERAISAAVSRYSWIEHWEFWNEPEMWDHFGELTYLDLLRTFFDSAKEANSEIIVAASTLVGPEYMEWLYDTSDAWFGEGNEPWDAIAYHPYNEHGEGIADPDTDPIRYDRVMELHDLMVERSGPEMKIWITEYGWYGEPSEQAANLVEVLDWMYEQPFIEFAHLHMLHDWDKTDPKTDYGLMEIVPQDLGESIFVPGTQFMPKPEFYEAFKNHR
jgi:hypothetical protein